ncbi:MAG: tRNA 2-thiouridine(34) synthase MnmA [Nitrospirae bacterium]|nr:tRNA 2-thiouridine(34) synthase MnmA [Nitrospirota bacterium]
MTERIVVGMSGGVDSIAAAALLIETGYDVIGVTLELWQPPATEAQPPSKKWLQRSCCKVGVARYVAGQLGIRHLVRSASENFYASVVEPFIDDYQHGRTPNPCVRCNALVKFEELLAVADEVGARYVATGHYARIDTDEVSGRHQLRKGADPDKDQSYFLYRLTQAQLSRLIFPLGAWNKSAVWEKVAQFDLPPDEIAESQEVCFVTQGDYRKFLETMAPESEQPGEIVDEEGAVVGEHRGAAFYTIGQRKGLGAIGGERRYVVALEPVDRRVIIGPETALYRQEAAIEEFHWVSVPPQSAPLKGAAKVRYRAAEAAATVIGSPDGSAAIRFDAPQRAIAPGQSAVFYDGDLVVGGGTIEVAR